MAVGTEVLAGKELSVRFRNQSDELLVRERVELLRRDGSSDSKLDGFHGSDLTAFELKATPQFKPHGERLLIRGQ